jgi:tetratricopeptide (TPR) repeat protein
MPFIFLLLLFVSPLLLANEDFDRARATSLTNPAEAIQLFEARQAELAEAPAWYQRDWLVVAARAYTRLKKYPQAEQSLRQADALLSTGLSKADILLAAGFVNFMQFKYQAANYWYQCTAKIAVAPLDQARVEMSQGQIAYLRNDFQSAEHLYRKSLEAAKLHQQAALEALLHNNLGMLYWRQQQFQPALAQLKQAMYLYTQLKDDVSLQWVSLNVLTVVVSMRDDAAFARYSRTISQRNQSQNRLQRDPLTGQVTQEQPPVGQPDTSDTELTTYLALLQAVRSMQQLPASDQSAVLAEIKTLRQKLQQPVLNHNAAVLLQALGAEVTDLNLRPRDPATDVRLPLLEQSCGPYTQAT